MKKPLAIILLVIGNTLLTLVLGFGLLLLMCLSYVVGIPLSLPVLALHIAGAVWLQRVCAGRGWLSPVKYWLCAAVPAFVISAAWCFILNSTYSGGLGYAMTFLPAIGGLLYSGGFLAVLGITLFVKKFIDKISGNTQT